MRESYATLAASLSNVAQVRSHIERLPLDDPPALFGLHANADITVRVCMSACSCNVVANAAGRARSSTTERVSSTDW